MLMLIVMKYMTENVKGILKDLNQAKSNVEVQSHALHVPRERLVIKMTE